MNNFHLSKVLIPLIFATIAATHRVTESVEDVPDVAQNTTTLYPVANKTSNETDSKPQPTKDKTKISDATLWKLDTSYGETDGNKKEEKSIESGEVNKTNGDKEFKPSPHLGTFVEEEIIEITPTRPTLGDFRPLKKPPTGFLSSPKDQFKSSLYHKDPFRHQNEFPYKFEPSIFTKPKGSWHHTDLDTRPTVEAPSRVPAGGLYRSPDAFKEKPTPDDDFGLDFNDLKENNHLDVKKRMNPWENLLRLMTALIPVGLIVSALTPSVITVHSTDNDNPYSNPIFRRSDAGAGIDALAPISEPCRRRLLCELHAEHNYTANQPGRRRGRQCFRIPCEDPQALANTLQWLLSRQQASTRGQHFT